MFVTLSSFNVGVALIVSLLHIYIFVHIYPERQKENTVGIIQFIFVLGLWCLISIRKLNLCQ